MFVNIELQIDPNYSDKDMTGFDLTDRTDMSGIVIHGLCLSHEKPADCLPSNLTGTTFIACNLDNVRIPVGNTLMGCSHRMFEVQSDGKDWLIDDEGKPISLLNPEA